MRSLLNCLAPIALISWGTVPVQAANQPTGCRSSTKLYAIYMIPVNYNQAKLALEKLKPGKFPMKEVENTLWGAPYVPLHITLADFAQNNKPVQKHANHCPHHHMSLRSTLRKISKKIHSKSFHISEKKWCSGHVHDGRMSIFPIKGPSSTLENILQITNGLHLSKGKKVIGHCSRRSGNNLHVTFDNPFTAHEIHTKKMKKFLGELKWKFCIVRVIGSESYKAQAPGDQLKKIECVG